MYDLQNDPWQENNLIDHPECAAIKEQLKKKMHAYGRKTGDPRSTGDMDLFNETLKVQDLLWPEYRKGVKFRRQVMGKPYSEMKKHLGIEQ